MVLPVSSKTITFTPLEPITAPTPPRPAVPGGSQFHICTGNGSRGQLHFTGRPDGDTGDLIPVLGLHFFNQVVIGETLQAVIRLNFLRRPC